MGAFYNLLEIVQPERKPDIIPFAQLHHNFMPQNSNKDISAELKQARDLTQNQEYDAALLLLKPIILADFNNKEAWLAFSELLAKIGQGQASVACQGLASDEEKNNAEQLFEAAYTFIDLRQFDLAQVLLEKCLVLRPGDPDAHYELGFSLMSLRNYNNAAIHFAKALKTNSDFDTNLNLSICHLFTGNIKEVKSILRELKQLAADNDELAELELRKLVVERLEECLKGKNFNSLSPQDWYYILYGGVLLAPPDRIHESFIASYDQIALLLLQLAGLLRELGQHFEVVEYYSELSKPIATAFGEIIQKPVQHYKGTAQNKRALLIMAWAGDIVGPHESFINIEANRTIFALAKSAPSSLPISMDIVGMLCQASAMPWDETWKIELGENGNATNIEHIPSHPEQASQLILQALSEQETLAKERIQSALSYYKPRINRLLIGKKLKERPEYSAEIIYE